MQQNIQGGKLSLLKERKLSLSIILFNKTCMYGKVKITTVNILI